MEKKAKKVKEKERNMANYIKGNIKHPNKKVSKLNKKIIKKGTK